MLRGRTQQVGVNETMMMVGGGATGTVFGQQGRQTAFHQTGVTNVLGLDGITPQTWASLDANAFYTTPDGQHWVATGKVACGTERAPTSTRTLSSAPRWP